MWYGVSIGSGRLAVELRSGASDARTGVGECMRGITAPIREASGDENGREKSVTGPEIDRC